MHMSVCVIFVRDLSIYLVQYILVYSIFMSSQQHVISVLSYDTYNRLSFVTEWQLLMCVQDCTVSAGSEWSSAVLSE